MRVVGLRFSTREHGTDFGIPNALHFFQILGKIFHQKDSLKLSVNGMAKYFAKSSYMDRKRQVLC